MILLTSNKFHFYKRTLMDVWNYHVINKKISKALNFVKVLERDKKRRRAFYKEPINYFI